MNKFLRNYLKYTKNTETPELIHLWCALSCLAGASERRLWLNRGMFNIYGNLFVILVGPPGVIAKTTSIKNTTRILRRCNCEVTEAISTKEKIMDSMVNSFQLHKLSDTETFPHTSVTFALGELNALLVAGTDMVLFLTRVWDEYDSLIDGTIKRGTQEVINPCFNMIGAATTDWFGKAISNDMLSSGFLARCVIAYAKQKRCREPKPHVGREELEAFDKCLDVLVWLKEAFGEVQMSKEAEDLYADWYINLAEDYTDSPKLAGYYERKAKTFVLKVGMLLALGDCRLTVETKDIKNALKIFDYTEPAIQACYAMAGANKLAPYAKQILRMAKMNDGKLSYRDILKSLYYELEEEELFKVTTMLGNMGLAKLQGGHLCIIDDKGADKFLIT
jgi:hypothetical protein